jgi:hypothetical protein
VHCLQVAPYHPLERTGQQVACHLALAIWPQASKDLNVRELAVTKGNPGNGATNIALIPAVSASEQLRIDVVDASLGAIADWLQACFASRAHVVK